MEFTLPPIDQLTEDALMNYIEKFLDINDFRQINNGKALLAYIAQHPQHPRIKSSIRKIVGLFHTDSPTGRVCSLQFIKEAMETNNWAVVESVQKSLLPKVAEIMEYRSHIKSLQRGSSYFIKEFDKEATDEHIVGLIKMSTTFFRMIHECIYVWGAIYFPGSSFDKMRLKLEKNYEFPKYPEDFKFFNQQKINNFRQNCKQVIEQMAEQIVDSKSQSSVEKKRESSVRSARASSLAQPNRSNSIDQIQAPSSKRSTKQRERLLNQQTSFQDSPSAQRHKSSTDPQNLGRQDICRKQVNEKPRRLKKKNSFLEPDEENAQAEEKGSNGGKAYKQDGSKKSDSRVSQMQQSLQHRFKTIVEDQQSDGGRYSIPQSDISSEFPENEHGLRQGSHVSARSELSQTNKQGLKLKKFTSKQIVTEVPKHPTSQNEPKEHKIVDSANKFRPVDEKRQEHHYPTSKGDGKRQSKRAKGRTPEQRQKAQQPNKQPLNTITNHQADKTKSNSNQKALSPGKREFPSRQNLQRQTPAVTLNETSAAYADGQPRVSNSALNKFVVSQREDEQRQKEYTGRGPSVQNGIKDTKEKSSFAQEKTLLNKLDRMPTARGEMKTSKPKKIKAAHSNKSIFQQSTLYLTALTQGLLEHDTPENRAIDYSDARNNSALEQRPGHEGGPMQGASDQVKTGHQGEVSSESIFDRAHSNAKATLEDIPTLQLPEKRQDRKLDNIPPVSTQLKNETIIKGQQKQTTNYFDAPPNLALHIPTSSPQPIHPTSQNSHRTSQATSRTFEVGHSPSQVFHEPMLEKTVLTARKPVASEMKQSVLYSSRFKKQSQVSLTISPSPDKNQSMISLLRSSPGDELKSLLQEQLRGQFDQLKTTLLSFQEQTISHNFQQLSSALSSTGQQARLAVTECGVQTKSKFKARSKFQKRKVFVDQVVEAQTTSLGEQLPSDQTPTIDHQKVQQHVLKYKEDDRARQLEQNVANISKKPPRASASQKQPGCTSGANFAPNTLLYALYRKKSLNL